MMSLSNIPALEIFLGILGFGFSIMFCTAFCRVCQRFREDQMEREDWRRNEESRPPSVYFIPLSMSLSEDLHRPPRYSQEIHRPPRYSTSVQNGPPPSYTELGLKPDDLPPAYSEHVPISSITPPTQTDMVQPQPYSQS